MQASNDIRARLLDAAEALFDRHGFTATGMDRLTSAAGISSRTLYKHVGSKNGLMAAVLQARDRRFRRRVDVASVDAFFAALETWFAEEGARGCLFLRTWRETGGDVPEIAEAMSRHKAFMQETIGELVVSEIGSRDEALADEILVLFEGMVHAYTYRGEAMASAARRAVHTLVSAARAREPKTE
ncbi:TetR/AcrR family transcriptional regulator [Salinicola aestuarinus]|uniref:TetR/AcrR family transcriptional regulator n=1 Tax=Salinicola aestuarinus TaxID=1949082 RepID=UPI000DA1F6C7|nr:TetR/AcrR family transcriptional regulator [Salinicola aestuarinus]